MNPWISITTQWDAWAYTAILTIGFPLIGHFLYGRLRSSSPQSEAPKKSQIYISIIVLEWMFSGALFILMHKYSLTLIDLGEQSGILWRTIAVPALLLAGLAILVIQNVRQLQRTDPKELGKGLGRGKSFYPNTRSELCIFLLLAMTTGICEELIFRGWLVNFLGYLTHSIWIGVVLAAIVFGFGHAYQGSKGMLTTGFLGLIFGAAFVFTSSLFPGQVIHFAINLVNGLIGAYAVSLLTSSINVSHPTT